MGPLLGCLEHYSEVPAVTDTGITVMEEATSPAPAAATGCSSEQWACEDGTCIYKTLKCDGDEDCQDNSDEFERTCGKRECLNEEQIQGISCMCGQETCKIGYSCKSEICIPATSPAPTAAPGWIERLGIDCSSGEGSVTLGDYANISLASCFDQCTNGEIKILCEGFVMKADDIEKTGNCKIIQKINIEKCIGSRMYNTYYIQQKVTIPTTTAPTTVRDERKLSPTPRASGATSFVCMKDSMMLALIFLSPTITLFLI